ncbi:hypothetical protein G7Z17_g7844 [Cylindrodendrum hubeiense]|uniref:Heterokaryon incompatibility domain-containing protein n=1 Tax=Cylindrodendrum hubeiense TaxID=595255 RepID=A0A9P5H6D7_9HYPO|nr:hypothetical protein G7Z17_g7844 [Cylindrodendrum hubeiense]
MSEKQRQMERADKIGPYKHTPLSSPDEIRLLHLLPGKFGDEIRMQISHVLLKQPEEQKSTRLSRSELQKTVSSGWEVFETPEGRYLFCYDPEDDSNAEGSVEGSADDDEDGEEFQTTWIHPDPKMDPSVYDLEPDSEIWAREPAFDCLSYVWGSQEDPEPAFVETSSGETIGSVKLGPNLASALHHLRYEDNPRALWVDVICINQKDPDEKAVAVKCLSKMYSLTTRVVVWLGPEENDSSTAISLLAHVGAQVETTLDGFRLTSPDADEPTWYDIDVDLPFKLDEWEAIEDLVSRPWFTRVWTVQEIVLANRLTIVHAGSAVISWALFRRAVECILDKKTIPKGRTSLGMARTAIVNGTERPLAQILKRHGGRSCLDPHDKVYGILALTPPKFLAEIVPNYEKPVADAYKETFLINIKTTRRWDLFGCTPDKRTIQAPSWVPDIYPEPSYGYISAHQLASGCSELQYQYEKPDKLVVKGIRFDTIQSVGGWAPESGVGALRTIRSWEPDDLFSSAYRDGGDVVCVILGCDRPFILRPAYNGTYHFLSYGFVYDLQDSQALLGPLPSAWRVQVYEHHEQEFRSYNQYFNTDTKELTTEDPRLGPISGWERIPLDKIGRGLTGDDPEVIDFFKNTKDGSIVDSDPRLSPEALEKRGVQLEAFVLT